MKELFEKVYIKSVDDLPKEGKCCICHLINEDEIIETAIFQSIHTESWFKNVDWYLRPAELSVPTDAEITAEINKLPYTKHLDDGQFNDGQMAGFEKGAYWMKDEIIKRNQ